MKNSTCCLASRRNLLLLKACWLWWLPSLSHQAFLQHVGTQFPGSFPQTSLCSGWRCGDEVKGSVRCCCGLGTAVWGPNPIVLGLHWVSSFGCLSGTGKWWWGRTSGNPLELEEGTSPREVLFVGCSDVFCPKATSVHRCAGSHLEDPRSSVLAIPCQHFLCYPKPPPAAENPLCSIAFCCPRCDW